MNVHFIREAHFMLFGEIDHKGEDLTERYVAETLRRGDAGAARLARRQVHVRASRAAYLALMGEPGNSAEEDFRREMEDVALETRRNRLIWDAYYRLAPSLQSVLELYYVRGETVESVSGSLGISKRTFWRRRSAAVLAIMRHVGEV